MFWEILKFLCAFGFIYFCFKAVKMEKKKRAYEAQGVVFNPWFPFLTDTIRMFYYLVKYPDEMAFECVMTKTYEGRQIPEKVGVILLGMPMVLFNTSDCLEELYVTKNAFYNKHEFNRTA